MLPTITIDVGTTSVKLCLFDADRRLLASSRHATPTVRDEWGEVYDIAALRARIVEFVGSLEPVDRSRVRRVSITGVGESGGLVRPDLTLVSPMILWHDHRGSKFLTPLTAEDRATVYRVTGLPVNPNYGLSKAVWAVDQAGRAAAGATWLNIAEYLAALLTGERWSEWSLASRTMALDLRTRTWSREVAGLVGLEIDVFPELRAATAGTVIDPGQARAHGLDEGVVVHVAGHDHMVGGVGADLQPGELLNSTGTTEGLLFLNDEPALDEDARQAKLANGIACSGDGYTLFASIPTGGAAFATLQSLTGFGSDDLNACLATLHREYIAGTLDLRGTPLVLPRFRGSPPPTKDAAARGVIAGVEPDTSAADLVLGCFLGMTLQFADVLDLFPRRPDRIKVIGPASRNPLWLQLKADLLGSPLSVSAFPEVVSRGAQALASNDAPDWEANQPRDVDVDGQRQARLEEWRDAIRERWEYMKGMPA